jgi:hypothetical protein
MICGPSLIFAFAKFCGRKMPARTPALLKTRCKLAGNSWQRIENVSKNKEGAPAWDLGPQ